MEKRFRAKIRTEVLFRSIAFLVLSFFVYEFFYSIASKNFSFGDISVPQISLEAGLILTTSLFIIEFLRAKTSFTPIFVGVIFLFISGNYLVSSIFLILNIFLNSVIGRIVTPKGWAEKNIFEP